MLYILTIVLIEISSAAQRLQAILHIPSLYHQIQLKVS